MRKEYTQNIKVLASQTDLNTQMGLVQSLGIIQDNMCEYFRDLKCDGITLIPQCGCFFVVTKTRVHFDKFAKWLDVFKVSTELYNMSRVAVALETNFRDSGGEIFATCYQELCAMDKESRRLRMINTTPFPTDLDVITDGKEKIFNRLNIEYSDDDIVSTITISPVNIDMYQHTNNVEYVRLMMATLDREFLLGHQITDFEIQYVSESKCGDEITIYRKQIDNVIYFELRRDDSVVTRATMSVVCLN